MAAPTQKGGVTLVVGINGYTYANTIVEEARRKPTGNVDKYQDEDDNTVTRVYSDPGKEVSLSVIGKTGHGLESLKLGDAVSVNSLPLLLDDADILFTRKAVKGNLKLSAEDGLALT